jgi:hypothetical protein
MQGFGGKARGNKDHSEDRDVDGRMDLMDIFWGCGVDSTGSGWGQVAGCCECDETSLIRGLLYTCMSV